MCGCIQRVNVGFWYQFFHFDCKCEKVSPFKFQAADSDDISLGFPLSIIWLLRGLPVYTLAPWLLQFIKRVIIYYFYHNYNYYY